MRHAQRIALIAVLTPLLAGALSAQALQAPSSEVAAKLEASRARLASESYVTPPEEIVRLVTASRQANTTLGNAGPDRRWYLRELRDDMPEIKTFGKRHLFFAGLQVDPAANRARTLTTRGAQRLELVDAVSGQTRAIEIPAGATASNPTWSPDGRQIAFVANFPAASHAYVSVVATGKSRAITPARSPLLATMVMGVEWADANTILAVLIPDNRGPEPARPAVVTGPLVRLWMDTVKSPQRNFASLLQEPFDQTLMEYYVTGQLTAIDVRTRAARKVGSPAMLGNFDPSPDGKYLRLRTLRKPFSYIVQYQNFGATEEIWDLSGKVLAVIGKRSAREAPDTSDTPGQGGGLEGSRRSLSWMPNGEGLYYIEATGRDSAAGGGGARPGGGAGAGGGGGGGEQPPIALIAWSAGRRRSVPTTPRCSIGRKAQFRRWS